MVATEASLSTRESWNSLPELQSLLPPLRLAKSSGSIDRYGFMDLLAARCGMRAPRRAFAEWVHGWIWDANPIAEDFGFSKLPRDLSLIVRNEQEKVSLVGDGFTRVVVGGLPFAYVEQQHARRNTHSLLAFPPHSAEAEKVSSGQEQYMDFLESIKHLFEGIYVSIYYLDWDGPMHRAAIKRGLSVIQGACPEDANSLYRMRAMFDAFECVTSNTIGSHMIYALHSGCKFSFGGPMFAYDAGAMLAGGNPHGHSAKYVQKVMESQDPAYLRRRFGRFFVDSPRGGVADAIYGAQEVGAESRLSSEQIIDVLGWTWRGQVSGYAAGATRRLYRWI